MATKKRIVCLAMAFGIGSVGALVGAEQGAQQPLFLSLARQAQPMGQMPSNISVITKEDIQKSGAQTLDEVLDSMPSSDQSRSGTLGSFTTLRMRGVPSSSQVQVIVDDRPVGGISTQFTDLSQIPVNHIERIEIVRGGSSVLYGANTIGGIVHIITKKHTDEKHAHSSIGYESRSFKSQVYKMDLGMKKKGFDVYVNANKYFTNGFQQNADSENESLFAKAGYTFKNSARISLDYSRTDHEIGDPQGTTLPPGQWDGHKEHFAVNTQALVRQDIDTGSFKTTFPLGSLAVVETTVYGSEQDYDYFPTEHDKASYSFSNSIVGNDTRLFFGKNWMAGASYQREEQDLITVQKVSHITNWGMYLQKSFTFGPWDLIPALRMDHHSTFGHVYNPRLTTVYHFTDNVKFSANAARSFRAPSFLELFYESAWFNGNKDLRAETAWTYDVGTEYAPSDKTNIKITGFYTRIRERITPAMTTYVNAPHAELSGIEFESTYQLLDNVSARTNYTHQKAIGNSLASIQHVPLRLTPKHLANFQLSWQAKNNWTITNALQYVHKQHQKDGEKGIELPSYALWNVHISKKILGADLFFQAKNITNKRYAESFGLHPVTYATTWQPQPGRTYSGGVTVRFLD